MPCLAAMPVPQCLGYIEGFHSRKFDNRLTRGARFAKISGPLARRVADHAPPGHQIKVHLVLALHTRRRVESAACFPIT